MGRTAQVQSLFCRTICTPVQEWVSVWTLCLVDGCLMSRFFGCCLKCSRGRKSGKGKKTAERERHVANPPRVRGRKGVDYAITRPMLHLAPRKNPPFLPVPRMNEQKCRDKPDSKANVKCTRQQGYAGKSTLHAPWYPTVSATPFSTPLTTVEVL